MKVNLGSAGNWVRFGFVSSDIFPAPAAAHPAQPESLTETPRKTSPNVGSFRHLFVRPASPLKNGFVSSNCIRLLLIAAAAASLAAQGDPGRRVDEIFRQWDKPATPGASVAIVQGGKLLYQKGYGIAHLEYDIPIAPDTIFHVASVSKQFTAMSIVLLEQDGKLSIDDDVHKYLPELPDYGHTIAIRNLLQHTSGIRDQWQTLGLAGWQLDDVITQKQILRMLFRQRELNFTPGSRYLYSNSGFTLLAEIVARVSGKPFPQFAEERIFHPLGMTRTHVHDDHQRIVHDRAYSYEMSPAAVVIVRRP